MIDTAVPRENAVVAVYHSHDEAEAAVKALQSAGIALQGVSVVGKGHGSDEGVVGSFTTGSRRRHLGRRSGFWNVIWDLLDDTGTFYIPGSGPIMVAGPVVARLVSAAEGAGEGVEQLVHAVEGQYSGKPGTLASALTASGMPAASAHDYEAAIDAGRFLLIVHGSAEVAARAKAELERTGAAQVVVYAA